MGFWCENISNSALQKLYVRRGVIKNYPNLSKCSFLLKFLTHMTFFGSVFLISSSSTMYVPITDDAFRDFFFAQSEKNQCFLCLLSVYNKW